MDENIDEIINLLNNKKNVKKNDDNKIIKKFKIRTKNVKKKFQLKNKYKPEFNLNTQIAKDNFKKKNTSNKIKLIEESRMWSSKHLLFKTFSKYLNNPKMYLEKFHSEMLKLYKKYKTKDSILTLLKDNEIDEKKRYLEFRPYLEEMNKKIENEDRGYYYKFGSSSKIIELTLKDNGFIETNSNKNWSIFWNNGSIKSDFYINLVNHQKVNHLPKSVELCRKDLMSRNISKMSLKYGKSFNFIPLTFILPQDYNLLSKHHDKFKGRKDYICKPSCGSQGKGIFISNDIEEIFKKCTGNMIVSEYISNPLLFNEYKFDLRIYVVVTSVEPLKIYLYDEGLVRIATEKFNEENSKFAHLTNYSINKKNKNYYVDEDGVDGKKLSFKTLKNIFAENNINYDLIFMRIEDLIIKSILSVLPTIKSNCLKKMPFKNNCFELFGYDIMIDDNLNPWLLEINIAPSLACETKFDQNIKAPLIADILNLIGIPTKEDRYAHDFHLNEFLFPYLNLEKKINKKSKKFENEIIQDLRNEINRSGNFKLIFPSFNSQIYKAYIDEMSIELNILIKEYFNKNYKKLSKIIIKKIKLIIFYIINHFFIPIIITKIFIILMNLIII